MMSRTAGRGSAEVAVAICGLVYCACDVWCAGVIPADQDIMDKGLSYKQMVKTTDARRFIDCKCYFHV